MQLERGNTIELSTLWKETEKYLKTQLLDCYRSPNGEKWDLSEHLILEAEGYIPA